MPHQYSAHLLLLAIALVLSATAAREVQLAMTMMIRDEAVNLRSNLPLWISIVDYFVFLVDVRTTDDSKNAIAEILTGKVKGFQIIGRGRLIHCTIAFSSLLLHILQIIHSLVLVKGVLSVLIKLGNTFPKLPTCG